MRLRQRYAYDYGRGKGKLEGDFAEGKGTINAQTMPRECQASWEEYGF